MGRNPLWKDMRWEEQDDITFFNIRIPRELRNRLKEIAELEGTTISFLLRRQLITLVRKKCREHNFKDTKLPKHAYPGPRHQRPKRNRKKNMIGSSPIIEHDAGIQAKMVAEPIQTSLLEQKSASISDQRMCQAVNERYSSAFSSQLTETEPPNDFVI
jgi:hypothetical protein